MSLSSPHLPAPPSGRAAALGAEPRPSFDQVYAEHFSFVWRNARALGIGPASVDDVVQDVFLVVHKKLDELEQIGSLKSWLFGILRRVVSHHRRSATRKPGHDSVAPPALAEGVTDERAPSPEQRAEHAELARRLDRLLSELDDDKRAAFILSEIEQMTIAEISLALDVNANTVASRIRAARRCFELAVEREQLRENRRLSCVR